MKKRKQADLHARKEARKARAAEAAAAKQALLQSRRREMSISVTVERQGRDLSLEVYACIVQLCLIVGLWGAFSYERGGTLGLGHAQGVLRLMAYDLKDAKKQIVDWQLS